jgi:hypothetical protein
VLKTARGEDELAVDVEALGLSKTSASAGCGVIFVEMKRLVSDWRAMPSTAESDLHRVAVG